MSKLELGAAKTSDGFGIKSAVEGDAIRVRLSGNADMRARTDIEELLTLLHAEVTKRKLRAAIVDMTDLYFMNSSCFKAFVSWLNSVQGLEATKQYRVRFVTNPGLHWQRRSLSALQHFAAELVTIET